MDCNIRIDLICESAGGGPGGFSEGGTAEFYGRSVER